MKTDLMKIISLSTENSLDMLAEMIPGWIHLNNKLDFGLTYISERMKKETQINIDEAKLFGPEYIKKLVHPETTDRVVPFLIDLVKSDDRKKVLSYYQLIKLKGKEFEWFLSTTKILNDENLITISIPVSIIQDFKFKIGNILNENIYLRSKLKIYDTITKREKEIIKLIVSGKTSFEIAKILCVSQLTIKTHRQNIYRKLGFSNIMELVKFANCFLSE
jgi:DNA-binding CsgD family transcriptional regulator